MQIQKVLNNNVVVALDENGAETVLMGRGLGFGCRPGGEVCQAKVEKRFSMHSDQLSSRFQQLVTSIPLPHFMMSERIINHAKLSLGRELSDSIYVTLPDHISGAISRYREGIRLQNPLLWDIQQFYRDEYQVGLKGTRSCSRRPALLLPRTKPDLSPCTLSTRRSAARFARSTT